MHSALYLESGGHKQYGSDMALNSSAGYPDMAKPDAMVPPETPPRLLPISVDT